MKKIIFTLLGMLMMTSASAVEYQYSPLVKEGKKWVYFYSNDSGFYVGQLVNTTEMNGHNYINYYVQEGLSTPDINLEEANSSPEPNFDVANLRAFFREEDKRVYIVYNSWSVNQDDGHTYYQQYQFAKYFDEATGESVIYDFNDVADPYVNYTYGYQPLFEGVDIEVTQEQLGEYLSNLYKIGDEVVIAERCGAVKDYRQNNDMMLNPLNQRYPNGGEPTRMLAYIEDDGKIIYKGENYDAAMEYLNSSSITTIAGNKQAVGIRYYNLAGIESAEPFKGVNLKVTTYTDGTRTTEKLIK